MSPGLSRKMRVIPTNDLVVRIVMTIAFVIAIIGFGWWVKKCWDEQWFKRFRFPSVLVLDVLTVCAFLVWIITPPL